MPVKVFSTFLTLTGKVKDHSPVEINVLYGTMSDMVKKRTFLQAD